MVRRLRGGWHLAAIRPAGREQVWALPKGNLAAGERPLDAAMREVREETGLEVRPVGKLGDVRYVYTWEGERIFKIVSFYLFRAVAGRLGDIAPEQRREIAATRWVPLVDAPRTLTYGGERSMARRALEQLSGAGDSR